MNLKIFKFNINKILKIILLINISILTLFLFGCGFHLRGSQTPYQLPFDTVIVAPDDPFDPIYKQLRISLETKKITVIPSNNINYNNINCNPLNSAINTPIHTCVHTPIHTPKIIILDYDLIERPFAYGPDGEIRRETLTLNMRYRYEYYVNNERQIKTHKIIVRRFRQLNLNQNLGDMAEKIII